MSPWQSRSVKPGLLFPNLVLPYPTPQDLALVTPICPLYFPPQGTHAAGLSSGGRVPRDGLPESHSLRETLEPQRNSATWLLSYSACACSYTHVHAHTHMCMLIHTCAHLQPSMRPVALMLVGKRHDRLISTKEGPLLVYSQHHQ